MVEMDFKFCSLKHDKFKNTIKDCRFHDFPNTEFSDFLSIDTRQ